MFGGEDDEFGDGGEVDGGEVDEFVGDFGVGDGELGGGEGGEGEGHGVAQEEPVLEDDFVLEELVFEKAIVFLWEFRFLIGRRAEFGFGVGRGSFQTEMVEIFCVYCLGIVDRRRRVDRV